MAAGLSEGTNNRCYPSLNHHYLG